MKISIIDKKDITLKVQNSTIKFDDITLPFRLVDTLLIVSNITVNSKDLIKITDNKINIIFANSHTNKSSIITSTNQKNADLRLKQYRAVGRRVEIARYIIAKKLKRHTAQLEENNLTISAQDYLDKLEVAKDIETILGIEGSYSKEYFKHYFPLFPKKFHNSKRTKRPPLDPLNALLSFFYSLLYDIITVRLLSFGFDPDISYLHTPFRNHHALSSDLLELFRDQVNQFVKIIIDKDMILLEDFTKKGGVYLKYSGRKKLYEPIKNLWEQLEPQVNREIAKLRSAL